MRRWTGRIVFVIAVLACMATSRRKWRIEAALPPGTPATLPADARRGLQFSVEHSNGDVRVECYLNGRNVLEAHRGPMYLCPPGASAPRIMLEGHEGDKGCGEPKAPDTAYVRTHVFEVVDTWSVTLERTVTVVVDAAKGYGSTTVAVTPSPEAADFSVALEPSDDNQLVMAPERTSYQNNHFTVTLAPRSALTSDLRLEAKITIRAFGSCPKPAGGGTAPPCVPAGDAAFALTEVAQ